jgi:hypothetical protein
MDRLKDSVKQEQESNSKANDDDDDDDDDGASDPTEIEESVNAGGITDFVEAEAHNDDIKSFVREGKDIHMQAVLDHLSSIVLDMRTHRSKKRRGDATLHRFGF